MWLDVVISGVLPSFVIFFFIVFVTFGSIAVNVNVNVNVEAKYLVRWRWSTSDADADVDDDVEKQGGGLEE